MQVEKQDHLKEKERTAFVNEHVEQKNVMNREQTDRKSIPQSKKKVRNCECVFLTKRCVLFRELLTEVEINKIHKLSAISLVEGWGSQQRRNFGKRVSKQPNYSAVKSGGHTVTFLEEKFEKKLPHLFSFINKVIHKTDQQTG